MGQSHRWLLPYLVTGALLVAVVWVVAYRSVAVEREQTMARTAEQAKRLADFFEQNVLEIFRYSNTYLLMARREYLRRGSVKAVAKMMAEIPLNRTDVSHLTIIDKTGTPIFVSGHKIKPGTSARDRAYFRFLANTPGDQVYISLPHKGRNTGKLTIRLVRRINKPDGGFDGVIFAAINAANITKFTAAMSLGAKSSATLVGTDKKIRARSSYGRVGPGQDISGSRIWRELAQSPTGLYRQRSVVDDVTRYYAYRRLSEFPLIVAIGAATDDIAAAVTAFEFPAYIIALLATLVIAVLKIVLGRENFRARIDLDNRRRTELELRESEARSREILEKSPFGVAVVKFETVNGVATSKRLFANQALAELLGGNSPDDIVNMDIAESWVDQVQLQQTNDQLAAGADLRDHESLRHFPNGGQGWVSMNSRPIRFDGQACIMIWHVDVTERKIAESALRQNERRLRTITDAMPALITFLDADGRFQYANKIVEDWYAMSREEVLGRTIAEILGDAVQDNDQPYRDRALAGQIVTHERTSKYPDGVVRDVQSTYIPDITELGDVRGFFSFVVDLTASKQTEAALRATEGHLASAIESISEGFILYDPDDRFVMCNEKFKDYFPSVRDDLVPGARLEDIVRMVLERGNIVGATENAEEFLNERLAAQNSEQGLREQHLSDGRWLLCRDRKSADGYMVGIRTDITETKQAAERSRRSQQLEAIGQLTGGVAHDFNNILAAVIGNLDLIDANGMIGEADHEAISVALRAAHRGAELTDRLLAFSRNQELIAKTTDINQILPQLRQLAERTIGEDIAIELRLADNLWPAVVDPGQLENALLNLAINARDAMPEGGRLIIETANQTLGKGDIAQDQDEELAPGDYVMITTSDTGSGMPANVRARAFEPFFTTKDVGKGSGLGLSMVFGFVKQSGGQVLIDSKEGNGTTVRIFLPRSEEIVASEVVEKTVTEKRPTGDETLLVVEDDGDVRKFLATALGRLGYTVLEAEDGPSAVQLMEATGEIDLLLTDVILPRGMNGRDVAESFHKRHPAARILFSSGYTREILKDRGGFDDDVALLSKPYLAQTLAQQIREVLDN